MKNDTLIEFEILPISDLYKNYQLNADSSKLIYFFDTLFNFEILVTSDTLPSHELL